MVRERERNLVFDHEIKGRIEQRSSLREGRNYTRGIAPVTVFLDSSLVCFLTPLSLENRQNDCCSIFGSSGYSSVRMYYNVMQFDFRKGGK